MLQFQLRYGETRTPADMEAGHLYLDGACQGPAVDLVKPAVSFDHHAGCVRSFTLATCQQVDTALRLGLELSAYRVVVMNDLDADTVVAAWLLESALRAGADRSFLADPRIIDLVARIGFVDSHGPIVPSHPMHRPLTLPPGTPQVYEDFVRLSDRLQEWYDTGAVPTTREFPPAPWFGVRSDGSEVSGEGDFSTAYLKATAALAMVPGPGGTIAYTIGKRSEFVSFDVSEFLRRMNELEPGWGGGSTIGGAPRSPDGSRSRLDQGVVRTVFLEVAGK